MNFNSFYYNILIIISLIPLILTDCIHEKSLPVNEQSLTFLKSILSPITIEDFLNNYLQKKPMIATRPNSPNYYGPLVDLNDIQYAIENGKKFNLPDIEVVFGEDWKLAKRILKDGEWWTGIFEYKDKITASTAFYAVSQGYTLIFNRAQSVIPNVFQASWQLEEALGWLVNTNLYLTASGGAQGFEAHIDWMDGFIFQTAGTKRWKTYDPPLIVYPRPDMSKRPSVEFLLNRGGNSSETSSYPPPNEFVLRSGDLAYIPRGIVHEACTSKQDIPENISPNLEDLHPYEHPSTHLTFGLEVGKDYTVESLLHHYISTRFKFYKWGGITTELHNILKLQSQSCSILSENQIDANTCSQKILNPEDIENIKTIRFSSDNKILYFDLILSSQDQKINRGVNSNDDETEAETYNYLTGNQIYLEDFFHLLLSYIASDTTDDVNWNPNNVFAKKSKQENENYSEDELYSNNTFLLRQAVGINKFTSSIKELNAKKLFPLGVEIVIDRLNNINLNDFFLYLIGHQMFSITSYEISTKKSSKNQNNENSLLSLLWKTISLSSNSYISSPTSFNSLQFYEVLSTTRDNGEYITLGSDKQLSYLNKFFSSNFLNNNERVFNLSILLTEDTESELADVNQFNRYNWNNFKDKSDNLNKQNFNNYLKNIDWSETKDIIQKMLYQLFSIDTPQQDERNLCSAYARMINTIKEDKQKRKRNGLNALRNAGHNL